MSISSSSPNTWGRAELAVEQQRLQQPCTQRVDDRQIGEGRNLVDRRLAENVRIPVIQADQFCQQNDQRRDQDRRDSARLVRIDQSRDDLQRDERGQPSTAANPRRR